MSSKAPYGTSGPLTKKVMSDLATVGAQVVAIMAAHMME